MIDEKKLTCIFIYSAYSSGYCGLMLPRLKKEEHMALFKDFIEKEKYHPETEINETQKEMMISSGNNGIRNYIYFKHFDVVKRRIEEQLGEFGEAIKAPLAKKAALNCPANLYRVTEVFGSELKGKNIISSETKTLRILRGLETPNIGDIVSGHWDFFLEVLNDEELIEKYRLIAEPYFQKIL